MKMKKCLMMMKRAKGFRYGGYKTYKASLKKPFIDSTSRVFKINFKNRKVKALNFRLSTPPTRSRDPKTLFRRHRRAARRRITLFTVEMLIIETN